MMKTERRKNTGKDWEHWEPDTDEQIWLLDNAHKVETSENGGEITH